MSKKRGFLDRNREKWSRLKQFSLSAPGLVFWLFLAFLALVAVEYWFDWVDWLNPYPTNR